MPTDFKKTDSRLYAPGTSPGIIDVPDMPFLMMDGRGDPNTSKEYAAAVEALYGITYSVKMDGKRMVPPPPGYFDFVVPPLEGLWALDDGGAFLGGGMPVGDKGRFVWTMMLRVPEYVTADVLAQAKLRLSRKKPELNASSVRLERFHEGLCAQVMHLGPYDDEPATVARLSRFIHENGYTEDMAGTRRHHEIYLGDPRRTAPEKLRTVIRHPIRKAMG